MSRGSGGEGEMTTDEDRIEQDDQTVQTKAHRTLDLRHTRLGSRLRDINGNLFNDFDPIAFQGYDLAGVIG